MTDARPETTSDGRHWIAEDIWTMARLPLQGESEGIASSGKWWANLDSILDRVWDDFVAGRRTT
jgi:hypothetical protein